MKSLVIKIIKKILLLFPMRNYILFESVPCLSDNAKYVFEEMCRRGLNKKYKIVWMINADEFGKDLPIIDNVVYADKYSKKSRPYYWFAKAIICSNEFLPKKRKNQYYLYLAHGCALKNTVGKYCLPDECKDAEIITVSDYLRKYDAVNLTCREDQFRVFGFPRNDRLFDRIDFKEIFPEKNYKKVIYWLPTYRQNKNNKKAVHSNISMPILYDEAIAEKVNECAKQNDVLLVVKPHPAQDVSRLKQLDMSNLTFIDNDYLVEKNAENYQVLGNCDALISDYSSVYYDYLLCNKPIGLCWDDFEEYNKREGFTVDINYIMSGGEKIYNADDLCSFITRVAQGEDSLKEQREQIRDTVQKFSDGNSTKRVVDYIEGKLQLLKMF